MFTVVLKNGQRYCADALQALRGDWDTQDATLQLYFACSQRMKHVLMSEVTTIELPSQ